MVLDVVRRELKALRTLKTIPSLDGVLARMNEVTFDQPRALRVGHHQGGGCRNRFATAFRKSV